MNTGFLGPAVATVLTACGIETYNQHPKSAITGWLQQYLPLAVLKLYTRRLRNLIHCYGVATVLTACGIETWEILLFPQIFHWSCNSTYRLRYWNSTSNSGTETASLNWVATVLTACGIETTPYWEHLTMLPPPLQQYLPFTVFNRIYDKTPRRLIWSARGFVLVILIKESSTISLYYECK